MLATRAFKYSEGHCLLYSISIIIVSVFMLSMEESECKRQEFILKPDNNDCIIQYCVTNKSNFKLFI